MPNILFASNSIGHFPGSELDSSEWSHDSDRVPYAIRMPLATISSSPPLEQSATDQTWFHWRHATSSVLSNESVPLFEVVNEAGERMCRVTYQSGSAIGYGIAGTIASQAFSNTRWSPFLTERMRTYDLMIEQTSVQCTIRLYVNEVLMCESVFSIGSPEAINAFWIGGVVGQSNNPIYRSMYSEILVADADTRNARLDLLRPTAAGAYSNWQGLLSSLSDDDPTTGMTTTLANQNQSTVLTPYGGANNISNVVQVTTSVRGINSPENLQHLIRMSGVDYLTPNFAVPDSKGFQITDWRLNPATSQPWEASDLSGTEFGFRSIA
jgi:hypothetical protein